MNLLGFELKVNLLWLIICLTYELLAFLQNICGIKCRCVVYALRMGVLLIYDGFALSKQRGTKRSFNDYCLMCLLSYIT